ncbi:hypothetical protein QV06_06605 [Gallibacterium genomosp. 3]|uniref:Peptidase S6 domain-containing protein n=1 Tax=Gallibacterium genomosp. 3 TaxID=505345 RepID=A0A1A7PP37_9PAST|nr:S6 family peptidase [Gallibacterium genomosp. 3]OBX04323.1 hypothetical protein QV06_06605 [Gallibacterium genomosp. 3]
MKANKKAIFYHTITSLYIVSSPSSFASIVRGDINYQYFRDFAENKGEFSVGSRNITIYNKEGNSVGTMLPNIPMIDFSVVNSNGGFATLTAPQYVVSVAHNGGYTGVQFGAVAANHPDNHTFTYQLVHNNNYQVNETHPYNKDYQFARLRKLVTEVTPIDSIPEVNAFPYRNDQKRYPVVLRAGGGTQKVRENGQDKWIAGPYAFLTGSATPRSEWTWVTQQSFPVYYRKPDGNFMGDLYGPMVSVGLPGDSGSGVFVYDTVEQKWWLLATTQSLYSSGKGNLTLLTRKDYHDEIKNNNSNPVINNTSPNTLWVWQHIENNGQDQLISSEQTYLIDTYNETLSTGGGANSTSAQLR